MGVADVAAHKPDPSKPAPLRGYVAVAPGGSNAQ